MTRVKNPVIVIGVIRAHNPDTAMMLAETLGDILVFGKPGEAVTIRPSGSAIVVTVTTRVKNTEIFDCLNDTFNGLALDGFIDDGDDEGWQFWTDGTGTVTGILGTNEDAWNAFAALLPGSTDTLANLANVAVRISSPERTITVTAPSRSSGPATVAPTHK